MRFKQKYDKIPLRRKCVNLKYVATPNPDWPLLGIILETLQFAAKKYRY